MKQIYSRVKVSTVPELIAVLQETQTGTGYNDTIEDNDGPCCVRVSLIEETLTDGSKVFSTRLELTGD